jgi:hypothetical protein
MILAEDHNCQRNEGDDEDGKEHPAGLQQRMQQQSA